MQEYKVVWQIELDAESVEEAAFKALMINRDSDSIAVVYEVTDEDGVTTVVDLDDPDTLQKVNTKTFIGIDE